MANDPFQIILDHHHALTDFVKKWTLEQEQLVSTLCIARSPLSREAAHQTEIPGRKTFSLNNAENEAACHKDVLRIALGANAIVQDEGAPEPVCDSEKAGRLEATRAVLHLKERRKGSKSNEREKVPRQREQNQPAVSSQEADEPAPLQANDTNVAMMLPRGSGLSMTASNHDHSFTLFGNYWRQHGPGSLPDLLLIIERSHSFEAICAMVIIMNSVILALDSDRVSKSLAEHAEAGRALPPTEEGTADMYRGFMTFFSVFYTLELLLRIVVQRRRFLFGRDRYWNMFDFALVFFVLQDQVFDALVRGGGNRSQNMSYLRALRLGKMMRLLRIVRALRMFRQLRLVLYSLLGSMQSMVWSIVLCFSIMFLFGVCFAQGVSNHLIDNWSSVTSDDREDMLKYWGSVFTSMNSLWMAHTGGIDWKDISWPLMRAGPHFYLIFLFYIGFFLFVVANSITSLFLDSAMQYAERDHHQIIHEQLRRKHSYVDKVMTMYLELDPNHSGQISHEAFVSLMSEPKMLAFAASLDLEPTDLEQFYGILSNHGKVPVDLEAFVVGCIKLRGAARSMDLIDLLISQRQAVLEHRRFQLRCEKQFTRLEGMVCQVMPCASVSSSLSHSHAGVPWSSSEQLPAARQPARASCFGGDAACGTASVIFSNSFMIKEDGEEEHVTQRAVSEESLPSSLPLSLRQRVEGGADNSGLELSL